jgi:pimeloyl-ACP methyl ester carboxylesterase
MMRIPVLTVALATVLLACLWPVAGTADDLPRFEIVDCWFERPAKYEVTCGKLVVPENRSRMDARVVRLPVVVVKSASVVPFDDPVLFIGGGPGGPVGLGSQEIANWWRILDHSWALQRHSLVLFDQRGVGRAEPNLDCPEFNAATTGILQSGGEASKARELLAIATTACRDRLVGMGYDLASYTTAASAADIADLRRALAIRTWTLYGTSYGTRLALTVLRDHPEGVASVILDSVYPPDVYGFEEGPLFLARSLAKVFDRCMGDEICRLGVPDIEHRFRGVFKRLNENPAIVTRSHPLTNESLTIPVTGAILAQFLHELSLYAELYRALPLWVHQIDQGNPLPLEAAADFLLTSVTWPLDEGVYMSVECADEYPLNDKSIILANEQRDPEYGEAAYYGLWYDLCELWGAAPAKPENRKPAASDVPVLLLAGEFDSRTPPEWARLAASHLPNSYVVEVPGVGHDVINNSRCGAMIFDAFLSDPHRDPSRPCPPWEARFITP